MAKQKAVLHWSCGGDWSETGTFIRKPSTGWIHKDEDLTDGSAVRYRVAVSINESRTSPAVGKTVCMSVPFLQYLGCLPIVQSMRTLQYNVRTLVTK